METNRFSLAMPSRKNRSDQEDEGKKRKDNDLNYGRRLSLVEPDQQHTTAHVYVSFFVNGIFIPPAKCLSHEQRWNPSEYLVCEKARGKLCFVLCSCDGKVWCLRPRKKPLIFNSSNTSLNYLRERFGVWVLFCVFLAYFWPPPCTHLLFHPT